MPMPTDNALARIVRFEGKIPHMYLDTLGNVTVGVGFLLAEPDAAERLPFLRKSDRRPASAEDKRQEWHAVHRMPHGQSVTAASFEPRTALFLDDPAIDRELRDRLDGFLDGLAGRFDGFAAFPAPAQEALLDMAFNLGLGAPAKPGVKATGLAQFVRLADCVARKDWAGAAGECRRRNIGEARNEETRRLFLDAAG